MDALTVDFQVGYAQGGEVRASFRFALDPPGVLVLFGPSGAGKTTILRSVAGLEHPAAGTIRFRDEIWVDVEKKLWLPPQRRKTGYVDQHDALFPHLNVEDNVGFGLRGLAREEKRRQANESMERFGILSLEKRFPSTLSGGERRRVALARALARRPRLLLLDEPFAGLDPRARADLVQRIREVVSERSLPTLLVTHEERDAVLLGRDLAVVGSGRVVQTGPLPEVLARPVDREAGSILGFETALPGRALSVQDGLVEVKVSGGTLWAVARDQPQPESVYAMVRAEDVILSAEGAGFPVSVRNRLPGRVVEMETEGHVLRVVLDCGFPLVARVTRGAGQELGLALGKPLCCWIKAHSIHLVPR